VIQVPRATTTLITPALRTSSPAELLVTTSFSSPDWKVLICWHGFRRPVISTTAWSPTRSKVPRGRDSRSIPRVVTFSPSCPGSTSNPCSRTSVNSSAWMKWTCRRFGWVGSAATRERCWTVTPECASPCTPSPGNSTISSTRTLLKRCSSSRHTATTRASSRSVTIPSVPDVSTQGRRRRQCCSPRSASSVWTSSRIDRAPSQAWNQ